MTQRFNISDREHNASNIHPCVIDVAIGSKSVKLKDCDYPKNKYIYGMGIRMQSTVFTRKAGNGKPLLSREAMGSAFLTLRKGIDIFHKVPLEFYGFDIDRHPGGWFAQVVLPEGFTLSDAVLEFDGALITVASAVEILFMLSDPNSCFEQPACT